MDYKDKSEKQRPPCPCRARAKGKPSFSVVNSDAKRKIMVYPSLKKLEYALGVEASF